VPGSSSSSAPISGEWVGTGEALPSRDPRKTRASHPGPWTGAGAWWANPGSVFRAASGSATQSWAPCRDRASGVDTSEWLIPRPAVIRFSSPGRTIAW
jgi:hypothetical protein